MAFISYNKLWVSDFDNTVSKRDKLQDMKINQLKLEVHDSYKKDGKIRTSFKAVINPDVINKAYLDEKILKIRGHIISLEKNCNGFKILSDKQSIEDVLVQRAVKATIQILYDKGLFDGFPNADEVSNDFLFVTRRRPNVKEIKDDVTQ